MKKKVNERRKFIKYLVSIGTAIWVTPAILTVSAKKGHAYPSSFHNPTQQTTDNWEKTEKKWRKKAWWN